MTLAWDSASQLPAWLHHYKAVADHECSDASFPPSHYIIPPEWFSDVSGFCGIENAAKDRSGQKHWSQKASAWPSYSLKEKIYFIQIPWKPARYFDCQSQQCHRLWVLLRSPNTQKLNGSCEHDIRYKVTESVLQNCTKISLFVTCWNSINERTKNSSLDVKTM